MSLKKKIILGIMLLAVLYLNRFSLLFFIYEGKMNRIVSQQQYDYKDLLLTWIREDGEEEVGPNRGYVEFHFLNHYYTQIIYIPSDNISFAPSCSFDGLMIKKFKKNWYLCEEDWN